MELQVVWVDVGSQALVPPCYSEWGSWSRDQPGPHPQGWSEPAWSAVCDLLSAMEPSQRRSAAGPREGTAALSLDFLCLPLDLSMALGCSLAVGVAMGLY